MGVSTNLIVKFIWILSPIIETFFHFPFRHICKVQPGVLYCRLNRRAAIDVSKKEAPNVRFIKVFWQLSFQKNCKFPREQGLRDTAVQLPPVMIKTVSQFEWADTETAATSTDVFGFINQPVFPTELDCLRVATITGNNVMQNSFCLWSP